MSPKSLFLSLGIAALLIGGAFWLTQKDTPESSTQVADNVSVTNGAQVVVINAKGGYFPRVTTAQADLPTIIQVKTSGTFDCSSSLVIPSLGYETNLPPTGVTPITLPPQKPGTTLRGLCSMGMYSFTVNFD